MKNYVAPEMDIVVVAVEDIITTSKTDNEVNVGELFGLSSDV